MGEDATNGTYSRIELYWSQLMKNGIGSQKRWPSFFLTGMILLLILFTVTSCGTGGNGPANTDGKMVIYTTLFPLYDVAGLIGGEHVVVKNMVPPGAESHDFEPKPKDMVALHSANLFIYNGAGFEAWIDKAVSNLDPKKTKVLNASEGITLLERDQVGTPDMHEAADQGGGGHAHGKVDPHIWLDPMNLKEIAGQISLSLQALDPANAASYKQNAEEFAKALDALDAEYKSELTKAKKKEFMVSHAAFGYLAHRYGLIQIPVSGITPDETPSQSDMIHLIETAKNHDLKYIGFEAVAQSKVADTIRREANLTPLTLYTIDNVTTDQLKKGVHYLDLMRENLKTLKKMLEASE